MSDITTNNTGILGGGGVEYSLEDAAVNIDELIQTLEEMKDNGLENVVMNSGNYRGARWASIRPSWHWAEDED